jgi:uncharacterized protein
MGDDPERHNADSDEASRDIDADAGTEGSSAERVDRKLLELLVCPVTKSSLDYDEARQELISRKAHLAFPIRRGVPHLLASEARHLDD